VQRALVLTWLLAVLGTADAAPRRRSRFAPYIDPTLVERPPDPLPMSVEFVRSCTSGSSRWLAAMRQRLARVLGTHVVASIGMKVVVDCASGNDAPRELLEPKPCEASLVAITPASPNDLVIDLRCRAPTTDEMAALIRSRLGLRRR
jgi:hypothetical protein